MRKTRFTILALGIWLVLGCATTGEPREPDPLRYGPITQAFAQAKKGDVTVTLSEAECQLQGDITNLPLRALWEEKGKVYEGCWSPFYGGLVVMYFNNKTVAVATLADFKPVAKTI